MCLCLCVCGSVGFRGSVDANVEFGPVHQSISLPSRSEGASEFPLRATTPRNGGTRRVVEEEKRCGFVPCDFDLAIFRLGR